ncbi:MAG: T9SS type A sorting domain-containing protein [Ignavibacteria bacterium]
MRIQRLEYLNPRYEPRLLACLAGAKGIPLGRVSPTNVLLKIYDILGNEVTTLVNEQKPAGKYEIQFDATNHSSGVYFYRLLFGSYSQTKKMVLLK